ncbi:MAG: oligosaccharide flippase family protein [Clostridia bacterium]|nr:oligosaccharide flippase family protein [Clostridia bacterium]
MNRRYKELFKNTGLLTISNFSSKILVFLLVPIYTNVLTQGEYGFYDLVYTSMQLLFPLCTAGISEAVMRYLMEASNDQKEVVSIGYKYVFISCIVAAVILAVNAVCMISLELTQYSIYILVFYIVHAVHGLQGPILKGFNKVHTIAVSGILGTVVMIVANLLFLLVFHFGLEGFFLANILGGLVPTVYIFFTDRQWQYLKQPHDKALERQMLVYALPLIVNTIGWWVNNTSDRYIVSFMCGVDTNGLLSVAYKIPSFISVFGSVFLQAWQISAIKVYQEENESRIYKDLFYYMNGLLTVVSSILIIMSHMIAKVMFGNFIEGWIFIPLLIISALMNQASGFVGPILNAKMNSKAMAKSAIIGIVSNIFLNIGLTLLMGPIGVTFATAISSFLIFIFREHATEGEIRSEHYKYVLFSWALLFCEGIVMSYLENYYIAAIILALIVVIYGKLLIQVTSKAMLMIKRKKV